MVYKCCVPNCKTEYAFSISKDILVFHFPKNVDLKKKWIKAIPKKSGLKQYFYLHHISFCFFQMCIRKCC